jgi:AAA domain-containing protein
MVQVLHLVIEDPPKVMRMADYAGRGADGADEPARGIPLLTLDQLREQSQNVAWLVKHVVPAESVGVLYGASGTFKSFIGIDLALHIAHGLPWLGHKTRKGPVLIIAAEGGTGVWRRIVAWHRERRLQWKDAPVYVIPVSVDLGADAVLVRDAAAAIGVTPVLVMVDTLSQTFSGEENSAQDIGGYLREIGLQFRACWQCAVLVVHHTGHSATERPRGSSALPANSDFLFGVFRDEKEMMATVECTKQKDGELLKPVSFSMKVVELAHDEDGDAITSLVATGLVDQQEVLDLMQHEAIRGRGGRNQLLLELALNGMEERKLRTLFYESVDSNDPDTKRQWYFRARKWASSHGLLEIAQGVVIRTGA